MIGISELNKSQRALIEATDAGFTVDGSGNVFRPDRTAQVLSACPRDYRSFAFKSPTASGRGYVNIKVHRLIAFQKFGWTLFVPGIEVRHLDDTRCNRRSNIGIGTPLQNRQDMSPEKRDKMNQVRRRERGPNASKAQARLRAETIGPDGFKRIGRKISATLKRHHAEKRGQLPTSLLV